MSKYHNLKDRILIAMSDHHTGDIGEASKMADAIIQQVIEKLDVLQPWVRTLTMMQQTVLLTATRGPDGIYKDHMVKVLLRWFRRCFLYSAMDKSILRTPHASGGGSFTGPFRAIGMTSDEETFDLQRQEYLRHVDELPHHFQLHLMHAVEILGYKHPEPVVRTWWNTFYLMIVNDAHLFPETESQMDKRLGDNEADWRAREEVTAL